MVNRQSKEKEVHKHDHQQHGCLCVELSYTTIIKGIMKKFKALCLRILQCHNIRYFNFSNFFIRLISSIVLVPLVLYSTYYGGYIYFTIVLAVSILGLVEWCLIVYQSGRSKKNQFWQLDTYALGLVYLSLFFWAMIFLRIQDQGFVIVLWCLLIAWVTDISAYVIGSFLKGPKLIPSISPNKTWAGLIGGILCGSIGSFAVISIFESVFSHVYYKEILSIALPIIGQIGDLAESLFKRKFNIKQSGYLIPGHGGILDRIDSLVFIIVTISMCYLFKIIN